MERNFMAESPYQIDLSQGAATDWLSANRAAQRARRAAAVFAFYSSRRLDIIRLDDGTLLGGRILNEVSGEGAVHEAIARLAVGGRSAVRFIDIPSAAPPEDPAAWAAWASRFKQHDEDIDSVDFINDWLAVTQVRAKVGTGVETDLGYPVPQFLSPFVPVPELTRIPFVVQELVASFNRVGDWDMVIKGLIIILYRYRNKLRREVYDHVLHKLLTVSGKHDQTILVPDHLPVLETENHVLMIETSRYLTNQLLYLDGWEKGERRPLFDNSTNGLSQWLLDLFRTYLQNDFWEFNSKPYQRLTTAALQNVYDFAWDAPVKLAARSVLDYISAKAAVSSNGLRRAAPFRRLKDQANRSRFFGEHTEDPYQFYKTAVDAQTSRMLMLSGLIDQLNFPRPDGSMISGHAHIASSDQMLLAALTSYRVPEIVLDIMMNKSHNKYYQRFFHGDRSSIHKKTIKGGVIPGGIEIYASSKEFLLSAGGAWFPSGNGDWDEFNGYEDCANAISTTLIPTKCGTDRDDCIQIMGAQSFRVRNNTGVLPGFACGYNVYIPPRYLFRGEGLIRDITDCVIRRGNWTFINATKTCSLASEDLGFYVAAYIEDMSVVNPVDNVSRVMNNFGFFEAASADDKGFSDFVGAVWGKNGTRSYSFGGVNEYHTSDGRRIVFTNPTSDKHRWCILSVDGNSFDTNVHRWPLAQGDIINSKQLPENPHEDGHSGWLSIDNPYHQQRLVLDMRDPVVPRRYQYRKNAPGQSAGALVSRDVFRLDAFWGSPQGTVNRIAWDAYVHGGSYWGFPAALTPPGWMARASPLVSVSPTSETTHLFWLGGDGSVRFCHWNAHANGGEWTHPFKIRIADLAGKVAKGSGLAAVAKTPQHLDLFWIAADGRVWTHWRNKEVENGDWGEHEARAITPPGDASPNSSIIAIAPTPQHVDVFWVNAAGTVRTISWNDEGPWGGLGTVSNPGEAAVTSSLSANARNPSHMHLYWISPNGAIRYTSRSPDANNGDWTTVADVAPAGAAWPDSGLCSVSRLPNQVDVYWISQTGEVITAYWNDGMALLGWQTVTIAAAGAAHIDSLLYAASRDPVTIDLVWTGPDRQLRAHWWKQEPDGKNEHGIRDLTTPDAVRLRTRQPDATIPPPLPPPDISIPDPYYRPKKLDDKLLDPDA
jgi:hypothetical protein